MSDMLFKEFVFLDSADCVIWDDLHEDVKNFIVAQAGKYGPSATAIRAAVQLGVAKRSEFFLSIEQVSILIAQLLCGGTTVAMSDEIAHGSSTQPQAFAYGRAMEHWYFAEDGSKRDQTWRRTALVGYGTFQGDTQLPTASSSIKSGTDLTISPGCGAREIADWGLGDSKTMTVIFAGHYVGGWLDAWYHHNTNGAQEEKFATLVPELMLATEPLRNMGAGLLSNGMQDPWLPAGGWYILGAGSYVESKGYPKWGSARVRLSNNEDYFPVGEGRRMRRRGLVSILGKPCNDRGSCRNNTDDLQYRCYTRQVMDHDMDPAPAGANMWGIAAGAFNFENWPKLTRQLLQAERPEKNWVLQAGGWGAGAFGCGTLYGGMLQALAAKSAGWRRMRMCWATKRDPEPKLWSKMGYVVARRQELQMTKVIINESAESHAHTLMSWAVGGRFSDTIVFRDKQYGAVAAQLQTPINQVVLPPTCADDDEAGTTIKCNKPGNDQGSCMSNMQWCCEHEDCAWHAAKPREDLRDFVAKNCNFECGVAFGLCKLKHVPLLCRNIVRTKTKSKRSLDLHDKDDISFVQPNDKSRDKSTRDWEHLHAAFEPDHPKKGSRMIVGMELFAQTWLWMVVVFGSIVFCVSVSVATTSACRFPLCRQFCILLGCGKMHARMRGTRRIHSLELGEQLETPLSAPGATPSTACSYSGSEDPASM
eukprot:TRINITY_DN30879_c0_g1_i1.p1 TRINITY_DN30879_c0_g1~~TRINITY_DN30879_c0_g1_i1.p1  ORF type:complete len:825 (+),score=85.68 TRINITY_DN30879_c0_g1_i1:364-2475(+)